MILDPTCDSDAHATDHRNNLPSELLLPSVIIQIGAVLGKGREARNEAAEDGGHAMEAMNATGVADADKEVIVGTKYITRNAEDTGQGTDKNRSSGGHAEGTSSAHGHSTRES